MDPSLEVYAFAQRVAAQAAADRLEFEAMAANTRVFKDDWSICGGPNSDSTVPEPMGSAATGSTIGTKKKGVDADHLAKIWRIDKERARRALQITEQLVKQEAEGAMARSFGTNGR